MDWNDLSILLAVSRCGTLTAAADKLSVNQTTVARRIDALEESLGTQLVERRRDGVRLTDEGRAAAAQIEQMEGIAMSLERSLLGTNTQLAGSLRVTTTTELAVNYPDLFARFAADYPHIELEVFTGYEVRSLARREADIAIRMVDRPKPPLFGRKLFRFEYGVYGARSLVSKIGKRKSLGSFPWVSWVKSSTARLTERWMKKHAPTADVVCRFDSALAIDAAVRRGVGIAFMRCAYGDLEPDLVRLRGPEPGFGYDAWVLTHGDLANTARVRAFMEHTGRYFDAIRKRQ